MYDVERPSPLPTFALPVILAMLALLVSLVAGAAQPPQEGQRQNGSNAPMNEAERAFSERMTNVELKGLFTTDGEPVDPKPESYSIVRATKTRGNDWLILARIAYGQKDVPSPAIPIPVKVYWADDTPVLSLTDLTIPGFGTFTSRVMFYEDRYAGTWQHGEKGGHLFGTITKADQAD